MHGMRGRYGGQPPASIQVVGQELSREKCKLRRFHPHEGISMSGTTCLVLRRPQQSRGYTTVQKQYYNMSIGLRVNSF